MQQLYLGIFWAIVAAFLVCGCILTAETEEKTTNRSGGTVPSIKEARPSL